MRGAMRIVFRGKMGELYITNHCKNAITEMQFMDERFEELRQKNPTFPMPVYDRLRKERPAWKDLHQTYDTGHQN